MKVTLSSLRRTVCLVGAACLLLGGVWGCNSDEYTSLVSKCKTIKLDDTEEHVLKTMGPPSHTTMIEKKGRELKALHYPAPSWAPTLPQISVDALSLRVEGIYCDENYRIVRTQGG